MPSGFFRLKRAKISIPRLPILKGIVSISIGKYDTIQLKRNNCVI
jgi:hypothetical protein